MYLLRIVGQFFLAFLVCWTLTINAVAKLNQTLRSQLPAAILDKNQISVVNDGHVPPYIVEKEVGVMEGASIDLLNEIAELLGIEIEHHSVIGLYLLLKGVTTGQYDMAIGPIADLSKRQQNADFIDYAASYTALLVRKGNPLAISTLADMCGKKIANTLGSSGETRLKNFSQQCTEQGKPTIKVLNYKDQPTAILSVKLKISDAFFGGIAMLSYYAAEEQQDFELTALRHISDPPERYYAAMVEKDSPLGPVLLAALQELQHNGTYQAIMTKWGLQSSILNEVGMNLAK